MTDYIIIKYVCNRCGVNGCEFNVKYDPEDAVYRGEPDTCPLTGSKAPFKEV